MQPIHFASLYNQLHIISLLVEQYGVNPNSKSQASEAERGIHHGFKIISYIVGRPGSH